MDERQVYTTFAILILALLLLTRLPAMAEYFTIDNVRLMAFKSYRSCEPWISMTFD